MNLENLISKYKILKHQDPKSTVKIKDLDLGVLDSIRTSILKSYNLSDPIYSTKEPVFYDTRRVVADSKYNPLDNQLFTNLEFDQKLSEICSPIVDQIQQVLPGHVPVITQLATILPQQKLLWHVDVFLYHQFSNKLHIPIVTNTNAFFDVFDNDKVSRKNMTEGSIWNINNLALHRSINNGENFRTHLIIDMMKQETVDDLLSLGINFFHTRLPKMTEIEQSSLDDLKKKYQ